MMESPEFSIPWKEDVDWVDCICPVCRRSDVCVCEPQTNKEYVFQTAEERHIDALWTGAHN